MTTKKQLRQQLEDQKSIAKGRLKEAAAELEAARKQRDEERRLVRNLFELVPSLQHFTKEVRLPRRFLSYGSHEIGEVLKSRHEETGEHVYTVIDRELPAKLLARRKHYAEQDAKADAAAAEEERLDAVEAALAPQPGTVEVKVSSKTFAAAAERAVSSLLDRAQHDVSMANRVADLLVEAHDEERGR